MANPQREKSLLADSLSRGLITSRQDNVADASVAHALNSTFSDVEVEAALNALGVKINAVLDVLEAHGLMVQS